MSDSSHQKDKEARQAAEPPSEGDCSSGFESSPEPEELDESPSPTFTEDGALVNGSQEPWGLTVYRSHSDSWHSHSPRVTPRPSTNDLTGGNNSGEPVGADTKSEDEEFSDNEEQQSPDNDEEEESSDSEEEESSDSEEEDP